MRRLMLAGMMVLAGCVTKPPVPQEESIVNDDKAARINTQLGVAYLQQGRFEQSMEKLQKAIRQDPRYADAHSVLAVLYERLGELDKARASYERAEDLAPDDSSILNNYGQFLCGRGDYKAAEKRLLKAAENPLYPTPELPLSNAGTCMLRAGDPAGAETFYLKALHANPRFAPALLRMAELRQRAGSSESALGFYQRYLEVAPQTPESLWLGIQIARATGDRDAVASYSLVLKRKYPDSDETRRLLELERNER